MGVWIETDRFAALDDFKKSHPVWVCGLKRIDASYFTRTARHTLYGCVDWNQRKVYHQKQDNVTPCMGVWIETA